MTRYLITGGCGFIGRRLVGALLETPDATIRVVDDLSFGTRAALAALGEVEDIDSFTTATPRGRIQLKIGSIADADLAIAACRDVDIVVHLAANTGVGPSIVDPRFDCTANVMGTFNYLEAARSAAVRRFVFASSGAVTGETEPPIHEKVPTRPLSPYGASKLAGEAYCSAYAHSFGLPTVALRFSNVYGPGSGHKQSVVAKFIRRALDGAPLVVYGDGGQTRDLIFIDDLVAAIRLAATTPGLSGEVFQVATSCETSVLELARLLAQVLEAEAAGQPEIRFEPGQPGDMRRNFADTTKALAMLGWQATTTLAEGLPRTVRWARAQRDAAHLAMGTGAA
jgi:UDP-glucose 4-epimerase